MAHSLRDALKSKAVETTHSESLELIAKAFGYENWNILSAKIDAVQPRSGSVVGHRDPTQQEIHYCSFCGKSQHEVRKLIAGPSVYICDECADIADDQLRRLIEGDEESARATSTERLTYYVEHASKGEQRFRLGLQRIERMLALRENVRLSPLGRVNRQREEPDDQWKAAAFARWHEPYESRGSRTVL